MSLALDTIKSHGTASKVEQNRPENSSRNQSDEQLHDDDSGTEHDKDRLHNVDFQYYPIDSTTQIRLLRITHDPNDSSTKKIRCDLRAVDVSQLAYTDYTALSYTWGEARTESDIHQIEIGDQTLWIRTNLYHFLLCASESDIHFPIFIDAVCIDQRNDTEKSHQITIMSQIYANANRVLAWVGFPHTDQNARLDALSRRLSHPNAANCQWDISEMIALSYLCSRQFWRRLWVVQELLFAREITIVCGTWRFPWLQISRLARLPLSTELLDNSEQVEWWDAWTFPCPVSFQRQETYQDQLLDGWQSALRLFHHKRKWTLRQTHVPYSDIIRTQGWPLYQVVRDFRFQQCRDRRDKVFALLGLLDGESKAMITPSYDCSLEKVFVQAAVAGLISLRREAAAGNPGSNVQYRSQQFCIDLNNILGLPDAGFEGRALAASKAASSYDDNASERLELLTAPITQPPSPYLRSVFVGLHMILTVFVLFSSFQFYADLWSAEKLNVGLVLPLVFSTVVAANSVLGLLEAFVYFLLRVCKGKKKRSPASLARSVLASEDG